MTPLDPVDRQILLALARIGGGYITLTNLLRQVNERELRDTPFTSRGLLLYLHRLAEAGLVDLPVSVALAPTALERLREAA